MEDNKDSRIGESEQYEKTGYLTEPYRIFHLRDCKEQRFDFHYHDFYKIIYFVDGRVDYKVEGEIKTVPHNLLSIIMSNYSSRNLRHVCKGS